MSTDLTVMSEQMKNPGSAFRAFSALTLVAIFAWLIGSPILAVVLDLGAIFALIVTVFFKRPIISRSGNGQ